MADLEKEGRDAVAAALAKGAEPKAIAKEICAQISRAAAASTDHRAAVAATVRGAMSAVFLSGQDLPHTAVETLAGLAHVTLMMRVGPEDLMTWVMEGIASMTAVAGPDARDKIGSAIEERFMGAGEVFGAMCDKSTPRPG